MNNSPEGAQGSANSKTPLALPQQLEAFAAQFNGETRDMLLLAAQSLSRRDNYHTSLTAVRGQLAQSEERVAKLEGALEKAIQSIEYLGGKGNSTWIEAHAALGNLTLLSSSKTN